MIYMVYTYIEDDLLVTTNPKIAHNKIMELTRLNHGYSYREINVDVLDDNGDMIAWAIFVDGKLFDEGKSRC